MSLGARPLDTGHVRAIIDRKMADFRRAAPDVSVVHLDAGRYFEAAASDPDVRLALETGFLSALEEDLRDPVLLEVPERRIYTCPDLAVRVLSDEPPEIHRPFVEGTFFRKLFRLFVPAEEAWQAAEQVREIMQRHFAFQLIAAETVLGEAA